ncbi:hypothetical protein G6F22_022059 [Rhizopus arrhizus]|nr:hypothetical protein G6F22_022059 [Rhizopus arrhizus]
MAGTAAGVVAGAGAAAAGRCGGSRSRGGVSRHNKASVQSLARSLHILSALRCAASAVFSPSAKPNATVPVAMAE